MSLIDSITIVLIITGAFFGQSIFGFGGGLLAVPLLSFLFPVHEAVTLVLLFQTCMGVLILSTHRETPWKSVAPLAVGLIAGVPIGIYYLSVLSDTILRIAIALFIFAYLGKELFIERTAAKFSTTTFWSGAAGLVGGTVQGMMGTGGPVFVMFLNSVLDHKHQIRAAIIFILFISNLVRIVFSIPVGLFTQDLLRIAVLAVVPFLLAVIIGHKLNRRLSEDLYRKIIYVILFVSGISLLLKAL
jgi:uncharacterized membrane protein YfcA